MWSVSGCARCGDVARRIASRGSGCTDWPPTGYLNRESFIRILTSVSPSHTQGGSRVRESCLHGSEQGAVSNDRPYRTSSRVLLAARRRRSLRLFDRAIGGQQEWLAITKPIALAISKLPTCCKFSSGKTLVGVKGRCGRSDTRK